MSSSITGRFPIPSVYEVNGTGHEPPASDPTAPSVSDESLMVRLQGGDTEAFGMLFQRYAKLVRRICQRILRDDNEAEDLTQDVFLFIHRKCRIFDRSRSSVASWIVHMTYQRAFERRRHLTSRHFYHQESFEECGSRVAGKRLLCEADYSAEAVFGRKGLEEILRSLSENQRETLRLYFFEGYTLVEISRKMGQSLGNVRHHYFRGLDKLRKQMFGRREGNRR